MTAEIGARPVVYGDISRLSTSVRRWAYDTNVLASSRSDGPLVVLALAYSPDWEERYRKEAEPWVHGLSPVIVDEIEQLRFAVVLRSGGASTLSRFLPRACDWATLEFDPRLINDIDLGTWLTLALDRREAAHFGT
jgi:hypothetical protein